jgi:hypothetical protein
MTSTGRDRLAAARDWFAGSDPGLLRLATAAQAVVTIGLALLLEGLFVRLTGALEARPPAGPQAPAVAAAIGAQHHGVLLIALVLGAVMGLGVALMGGQDRTLGAEITTYAFMPVAVLAALASLLPVAGNRPAIFLIMAVLVGAGTYLRRFGSRYATLGVLLWAGSFMSFFFMASSASRSWAGSRLSWPSERRWRSSSVRPSSVRIRKRSCIGSGGRRWPGRGGLRAFLPAGSRPGVPAAEARSRWIERC